MLDIFKNILNKKKKLTISDKDSIAALLGTNAKALPEREYPARWFFYLLW